MSMPLQRRHSTYAEYLKWPEEERVELIDGEVFAMSPASSRIHQVVLGNLFRKFADYLDGKKCRAYIAPFDVRLPKCSERDEDINTVVQPDLSIICDPGKLDDRGCKGAPDLIVEVISPASLKLDLTLKKRLYERVGVKEYWIVYPQERIVMVYVRDQLGNFTDGEAYDKDARVPAGIFDEWKLDMSTIFETD
jgi:Uma2 family endonuclease